MSIRIDCADKHVRTMLKQLLLAGLEAADPETAIRRAVRVRNNRLRVGTREYDLTGFSRIVCIGAGKASGAMAAAVERQLGSRVEGGLVVVTDGQAWKTKRIQLIEARHPVPDHRSEQAARRIVRLLESLSERDLVLMVLSGGASSLLAAPAVGLTLKEKQLTTRLLLRSGAAIQEINAVRKHLSGIKGGRLANATSATVISLILSDVPGDDPATVGSGPMAPDPSTFADAKRVLDMYGIRNRIPLAVRRHVDHGVRGRIPDTPKPGEALFSRVQHHVIGNNRAVIERMAKRARALGLRPLILTTTLSGEARDMGKLFGNLAGEMRGSGNPVRPPACLLAGGELTVTVKGKGIGGRAQEFALAAAPSIDGLSRVFVAGFGTDGIDGPTTAAGAIVDGRTISRAKQKGVSFEAALRENDSHGFFDRVGGHVVTGPTGTNVNDVYMILAL